MSKVTRTVKLFPFVYTALSLVLIAIEGLLPIGWVEILSLLLFVSLPCVWLCWRLSLIVRLCAWHRVQCLAMLLPLLIPICRIVWPDANVIWVKWVVAFLCMIPFVGGFRVFQKAKNWKFSTEILKLNLYNINILYIINKVKPYRVMLVGLCIVRLLERLNLLRTTVKPHRSKAVWYAGRGGRW